MKPVPREQEVRTFSFRSDPARSNPGGDGEGDAEDRLRRLLSRSQRLVRVVQAFLKDWYRIRRSRLVATLGPSIVVEVDGSRYALDLTEMHDVKMFLGLRTGKLYEAETRHLIEDLLRPGDTFVDVGANEGYFTVVAARLVGPEGTVVAVEPNPSPLHRLERNLQLNSVRDRVRVHCVAAGARRGTGQFFVSRFEDGWGMMVPEASEGATIQVPVRRVEDLVPASAHGTVIKVDVEGGELDALQGMTRILDGPGRVALIVEWNRQHSSRGLWEFLHERFRVFQLNAGPRGYALKEVADFERLRRTTLANLLCIRRDQPIPGR